MSGPSLFVATIEGMWFFKGLDSDRNQRTSGVRADGLILGGAASLAQGA